jgi:hypothetical protein
MKDKQYNEVTHQLRRVNFPLQYNIMLKAEHIPGKINSIADALSRSDSLLDYQH